MSDVKFTDNSDKVLEALHAAVLDALEKTGQFVQGEAQGRAPVDTGNLRDHIKYAVADDEQAVYIGTTAEEVPYAGYVELGTHKMRAQPFLKPAVADNAQQIRNIINEELKG